MNDNDDVPRFGVYRARDPRTDRTTSRQRNAAPEAPWVTVTSIALGDAKLAAGKSVELPRGDPRKRLPQFLTIRRIDQNTQTGEVSLFGVPIYRNTYSSIFLQRINEVHMVLEEDQDDSRPLYEQAMIQCSLDDVWRIRRVIFTHLGYPELTFRKHTYLCRSGMSDEEFRVQKEIVKSSCELVCRHVQIKRFSSARSRTNKRKHEQWDTILRRLYEGEDPTGKSAVQLQRNEPAAQRNSILNKRNAFTYSSGFCCLGGDSMGAKLAGFRVPYAFDMDERSRVTYKLNFPGTRHYLEEAFQMIQIADARIPYSTVWHLSCPCQPWSAAHTHAGKNDDANIAALSIVEPFLKKMRPTILTLEQTSGIVTHNPAFFAYLLNQITSCGYNVRYKIAHFQNYGLSSMRKRLIIFASR